MLGALGGGEPMKYRQPYHTLRFLLEPTEKVYGLDLVLVFSRFLETATYARLYIRTPKGRHFAQLSRHLYAIVQQQSQFSLIHQSIRIGD